jgi:hypothetical protein
LLLDALQAPIEQGLMSPADRLNILDDTNSLHTYDLISDDAMLKVLSWFKNEDNEAVMVTLVKVLNDAVLPDDKHLSNGYATLLQYYKKIGGLAPIEENHVIKCTAQAEVLGFLLNKPYRKAIKDSIKLYESTKGDVPVYLRKQIYPAVAAAINKDQLIELLERIKQLVPSEEEQIDLYSSIETRLEDESEKLDVFYGYLVSADEQE